VIGAARVLHFNKNGDFINQIFGNSVGQGKFSMAHGVAVDPKNGDLWIGDREQYRIVVYDKDGHFVKTLQMRNLICAIDFDAQDGAPVDLIFMLLAPESAGADHLKALARIARVLRDTAFTARLRATKDPAALYLMLTQTPTSHAA
jgi:hypothetical protein